MWKKIDFQVWLSSSLTISLEVEEHFITKEFSVHKFNKGIAIFICEHNLAFQDKVDVLRKIPNLIDNVIFLKVDRS